MRVVTFCGPHNSGKTTLLSQLIKEFDARRVKTAVVKSTKHTDVFKREGTDTTLLKDAGALEVILNAPDGVFRMEGVRSVEDTLWKLSVCADVVLCEGFRRSKLPKVAVYRKWSEDYWESVTNVVAVVSDTGESPWDVPIFSFSQVSELADFILRERAFCHSDVLGQVALWVNGERVSMKPFVERLLKDLLLSFVGNLKGGEKAICIDVRVIKE